MWAAREPKAAARRAPRLHWRRRACSCSSTGTDVTSPLLHRRSTRLQLHHLEVDIPALKAGANSVGGTVNDGFLAAIVLGLRQWHLDHGLELPHIRTSMAVNLRDAKDDSRGQAT